MRRFALCVTLVFVSLFGYASDQSDAILRDMSAAITSLGRYEAQFTIELNGESADFVGRYVVDGERYMLSIPGSVTYGDSSIRYTVDSLNREVVVERVTDNTPMLTSNPARAFNSLDQLFSSTLKSSDSDCYTLSLRPKGKITLFQRAELSISQESNLPISVSYKDSGDQVMIYLKNFAQATPIQPIDSLLYPQGYELIDLR